MLNKILLVLFVAFLAFLSFGCNDLLSDRSVDGRPSIDKLELRLEEIDKELSSLAEYNLRSGVGSIGFRSRPYTTPENFEWLQVDFDGKCPINDLVLVPTILRDTDTGLKDDAFPVEFKIIVGHVDDQGGQGLAKGTVNASFDTSDSVLPRIAPLILDCRGIVSIRNKKRG